MTTLAKTRHADPTTHRHPCVFLDRKSGGATAEQCQQISSVVVKNETGCCMVKCQSPWRLCIACIRQGYASPNDRVDAKTGLCAFHNKNGAAASKNSAARPTPPPRPRPALQKEGGADPSSAHPQQHKSGAAEKSQGQRESKSLKRATHKQTHQTSKEIVASALREAEGPLEIPTEQIQRFEEQPRMHFDPEALRELSESIRAIGQVHPGIVRKMPDAPEHYELIDGERRWRACQLAGIPTVRMLVVDLTDRDIRYVLSVASNFGAQVHTDLEMAQSMQYMVDTLGYSVQRAAALHSKSAMWGTYHLKVARALNPAVKEMLDPAHPEGKRLGFSIAVLLADYPDPEFQLALAQEIAEKKLTIHRARILIRQRAQQAGIERSGSSRKREPGDDVQWLNNALGRTLTRFEPFLEMPEKHLQHSFKRNPAGREKTLAAIDTLVSGLQMLRATIASSEDT